MTDSRGTGDTALAVIASRFEALGGCFLASPLRVRESFLATQLLIFDWDGVLGSGAKGASHTSSFNEWDSMGVNLLRYALYRRLGRLPSCVIVSGAAEESARMFAEREHLDYLWIGLRNKQRVLAHLSDAFGAQVLSTAVCFFDDVNDLALARHCGLRLMIQRRSSPALREHVIARAWADYVSGCNAAEGGVRECCELLLSLSGQLAEVIDSRVDADSQYESYLAERQSVALKIMTL